MLSLIVGAFPATADAFCSAALFAVVPTAADVLDCAALARTAADAAAALGVEIDQIAKSIIFRGEVSGKAILFFTAGGNKVDEAKAAALAGEPLGKADAALIRAQTGFAIGGVSPVGHVSL